MNDTSQLPDAPDRLARSLHEASIMFSLNLVGEQLIKDLAKLYRLKAAGNPIEIPSTVTIKDVVVRLS
jgi:hypothetical protein